MLISLRRPAVAGPALVLLLTALFLLPARRAAAQDSTQQDSATEETKTQKFLDHFDLGVSAAGELTNTVSGIEQRDANVVTVSNGLTSTSKTLLTIAPSRTVGELGTLRYTARPWLGFEFNFGNQRYTENYNFVTTTSTTPPTPPTITTSEPNLLTGGAQTGVHEITWGYIAHPPHQFFGLQPFLGAGGGTMSFHPTTGGGQHLPFQYRAVYYYTAGVDGQFPNSHFGIRAGFRQDIYLAPDFLQNYLTILKHVRTSEPNIGFYVRF